MSGAGCDDSCPDTDAHRALTGGRGMSAPNPLTAAERALLTAILGVVDLPYGAEYGDMEGRDKTLRARAARLSGCLQQAASSDCSLDSVITVARGIAAGPLEYTPQSPQQAAEREQERIRRAAAAEQPA
jgi:hypothetical protein